MVISGLRARRLHESREGVAVIGGFAATADRFPGES
jgi:hypothetical protein